MSSKENKSLISQDGYLSLITEIKEQFKNSQIKASIAVNSSLLEFYWYLGGQIVLRQKEFAWGSDFLTQLSSDLSEEFSNIKGFSTRNLRSVRQWYLFWQQAVAKMEQEKRQQVVAKLFQIPWGHNLVIIAKSKNSLEALFYVDKTIENGYSRAVLVHQMESDLYQRIGKAISNFEAKLPSIQSDLAKETLKDPYCFDFLTMSERYNEKELEEALSQNITEFLLELGVGFAFVGRQYKIEIDADLFRIDMLFYHINLRCYVVVELKVVDFKPEFAGKLNFYTSVIDDTLKGKRDNPTIGLIICKSKKSTIVEYALKGIDKPLGVSEYQLTSVLPKDFKSSLPQIQEIEDELNRWDGKDDA